MKSLDKNMLKTLAFFCVTFSEKYRDGADVDELKGLVINLSLTMRPDSVNPNASLTYEQYGEIMEAMVSYLACEDDDGAGTEFDSHSARTKLSIANEKLKSKIQRVADRINDRFSEQIESILANAPKG
ncbi:hypothetical protein DL122_11810 [Salmonella enterica subsp. salamae]|nr:hypothetical protein [Salmonella enterica subsp. salamae]ECI5325658.1 hypothetical protein [Salmonella enterica subsp. enterica serovar Mishmarhaemek]EDV1137081.1 hypothetical protein [Salmonella enterica subsp. enterica]